LQVTSVNAGKITVRFMHHQTYGFDAFFAGDSVAFVNSKTLMSLGTAKLNAVKLINRREMEIEVEGPLPSFVKPGLCIENLTWTPEVIIQNSHFERTNTRGLLLTTRRKVLIQNNTFYHVGMYPILIADDALSWYESGAVRDVTIRNNRFDECGYNSGSSAICIAPENHEVLEGSFVHKNIRIENNSFKVYGMPLLSARSVEGLVFANNNIARSGGLPADTTQASFQLTGCNKVVIERNVIQGFGPSVIKLNAMPASAVKTDAKIIGELNKNLQK
jgi:polygalacturonase